MAEELVNFRIHFMHGAVDGELDIVDVTAREMRMIYNNTMMEFVRTADRDGEEVEVTVRMVPLTLVTGVETLAAQVMEPMTPTGPAQALPEIQEPTRIFDPAAIAAGVQQMTPGIPGAAPTGWGK